MFFQLTLFVEYVWSEKIRVSVWTIYDAQLTRVVRNRR